jgi:hypothetical protein
MVACEPLVFGYVESMTETAISIKHKSVNLDFDPESEDLVIVL